jgi:redox-sensitive bicupin YhaK (pirin superfamily)
VNHRDTLGNAGSIGAGDVQWMTAGGGIMHEEMPGPHQGMMEGFQLWVNLPARLKMSRPRYQEFVAAKIPRVQREDGVEIRVIAGSVNGTRGPVTDIAADPIYVDVSLAPGSTYIQPVERGHAAFAYVFRGEAQFAPSYSDLVPAPNLVVYDDGDVVEIRSETQPARFLLVSGKPLHEPIARYGPFVMNTRQEIEQALRNLRNGTFVQTV